MTQNPLAASGTQTPAKVSILTKILQYFKVAEAIGMEIPETHVQAIDRLAIALTTELPVIFHREQNPALPAKTTAAPIPAPPLTSHPFKPQQTVTSKF